MNNLLHADFRRLLRDRLFWVLTAVMAIWAIILFLNHYSDKIRYGEQASLDSMFFSFAVLTGFASAAFCSLFTGREHSDGILRNKIIIGCSRTRIYLSGFLTCAVAMLLSTFAYMAVLCVLGIPVFGLFEGDPGGLLLIFAASALLNLVHVALFHLVSMLNSSKSASAIICMALSLLLLVAASLLLQRLAQPELIQQVQMVDGSPVVSQAANPKYLTGSTRILYQFFVDLLPSGQALQIASAQVAHPIQILLYSSGVTVLLNLIGIYLFNRKNLK